MSFEEEYAKQKAKGSPYDSVIQRSAEANGVSYDFLHKQLFMESRFNPTAKSPTGPRGIGQFTKATGRAYGLITDEDFNDPVKSIDAAARHIKDLKNAYGGDYIKAALAYNQGQGRLGSPQIAALDSGDMTQVSPEGLKYMKNLSDVAGESPFRDLLGGDLTKGAIVPSPKGEAVTFDSATHGVSALNTIQRGATPELGNMNVKGSDVPEVQKGFAQEQFDTAKAPQGWFEGTGEAVKAELATNTLGQLFRNVTMDTVDPMEGYEAHDTSTWSDEDFDRIRKEGVDPQFFPFLFDHTRGNKGRLGDAIKMAKENMEHQKTFRSASTSAQVVAGFAGALADPFTYAPLPGVTALKLSSKVAQGAALGSAGAVGSEALRESSTGIDAHYGTALVAGALIGGGLTALIDRIAQRAVPDQRLDMWDGDLEAILARHGEAGLANEFAGPSMRLEARETARNMGADDPSRMPWVAGETPTNLNGVDFVPHPTEPGAVRLQDGSVLSAGNPLNPLLQNAFASHERAARGVSMGGFTEIGYTLNRSTNEEVRGIGAQLFRSTTGTESGSHGKFGATAADIIEREAAHDHVTYNKIIEASHEAIKDIRYASMKGGREAQYEALNRRVIEALEDTNGTKKASLTPAERQLADATNEHFMRKLESLQNPAKYGNPHATSVLGSTRHEGFYFPNVYDDAAKNIWRTKLGGNNEDLQSAIMESFMASYASRPAVKARVDRMIAEANKGKTMTPSQVQDAVEQYAKAKAFGISHTNDFNRSHLVDDQVSGLVGAENNNFLEGRHLFDSDVQIQLQGGEMFSLNDLRSWELPQITHSYDRRVNGDIGIMGATGHNTEVLKDRITKMGVGQESKKEMKALQDAVKLLTGRARRDPDSVMATLTRSLSDMSFLAKNAYMGIQGISETAAMVTKGHTMMLMKGVPFFKDMMTRGSKATPEFLKDMHGLVFGRELDNIIRPRRQDLIMRLRDHADASPAVAKAVGSLKWATGEASARWPMTRFLTESSNYIADAGRQGVLKELTDMAHGTPTKMGKKLFDQTRLKSMSLTPEQFEGMQALIREATTVKNGKVEITKPELFQNDPRSMDIWRLGDKIADESILRPHKLSSQDTVAYGAGIKLAMQFKNFTMRSMNARAIRGFHDATKNGRAMDQTMQAIISTGMAGAMFVAMAYTRSVGMPEKDREKYLKEATNPDMIAYAALSRSSHIGAPLGLANMVAAPLGFDQARMVRTSITPRPKTEKETSGAMKFKPSKDERITSIFSGLADQVPGAGWALSGVQVGVNATGLAATSNGRRQDQELMTGLYNGLRGVVPNDPVTQFLLMKIMEDQGIEAR